MAQRALAVASCGDAAFLKAAHARLALARSPQATTPSKPGSCPKKACFPAGDHPRGGEGKSGRRRADSCLRRAPFYFSNSFCKGKRRLRPLGMRGELPLRIGAVDADELAIVSEGRRATISQEQAGKQAYASSGKLKRSAR